MKQLMAALLMALTLNPNAIMAKQRTVKLRVIETSDVHGSFFPYDFINRKPKAGSLARVSSYVDSLRQTYKDNLILLENGDVIRIPRKDDIVLVSGEVLFPNAVAYENNLSLEGYIDRAGGFTQMADNARVVVARRDGSFEQVNPKRLFANTNIQPGDQILVLPKVDEKKRQFWKDMTQILYQIAVSAKVVFGSW